MRIYISGQMTGLTAEEVKINFDKAERLLQEQGWETVKPILKPDKTWEECMLEDIEGLFSCDAIYMMSNWSVSKGARVERAIAFELKKQIIYE